MPEWKILGIHHENMNNLGTNEEFLFWMPNFKTFSKRKFFIAIIFFSYKMFSNIKNGYITHMMRVPYGDIVKEFLI